MPCYGPLTGYFSKDLNVRTGKRAIVFKKDLSLTGEPIQLPCGRCVGCRLERSRQWAMRCVHEAKLHRDNCFITLTYDDEYLPPGGTLVKRHLQLFMKRLRKSRGSGVRFYACGEYGERNARPHYHAILFNCSFPDQKRFTENARGEVLYTSEELRRLWPYGHNSIGAVSFHSAAYVARYVLKKITGDSSEDHYAVIDAHGQVYDRTPEFTVMSRRPGVGTGYFHKYGAEVYVHDSVIINGREVPPPRFYDGLYELTHPDHLAKVKIARKRKAIANKGDNTPGFHGRLHVKERVVLAKLKQSKRSL